ncbi:MAG: BtpA/SgcQ family protein [Candidatus Wallbacteria bacterium]
MKKFNDLFKTDKVIIGMIHVNALPGTPKFAGSVKTIVEKAKKEALLYKNAGIDAIAIENMHDVPYLKNSVGAEITAAMSIIGHEVKSCSNMPCGIQILAGANIEALAVAQSAELDFIRAEGFVFAHTADEGIIESCAGNTLRYRRMIGAENVLVFTDIKKKHSSHSITADVDIAETAHAAEFFLSDGVIVTGAATGMEASITEITQVKKAVKIPVLVGSGITYDNLEKYIPAADAFIVGSYFKKDGYWENDIDFEKTKKFMQKVNKLRS